VVDRVVVAPPLILGWQASDIESMIDGLFAGGVRFIRYESRDQDERGDGASAP
jgi:hypothetical protein